MPAKKRPASTSAASALKRKKINTVAGVIAGSTCYSKPVQKILRKSINDSLGVYKEERHELQHTLVKMIGQVVRTREQELQSTVVSAETQVGEVKSSHDGAAAEFQGLVEARVASADAESSAKEAYAASDSYLKDLEQKKNQQAPWVEVPEKLEQLKVGVISKQVLTGLLKCGKELNVDITVLDAIASGSKREAADRSTFEKYCAKEFEDALMVKVVEMKQLDTSDETLAAASTKKAEMAGALTAAIVAARAAKDAESAAKKPHQKFKDDLAKAELKLSQAQAAVQKFQAAPLASYSDLLDLQAPTPTPEPEAAVVADTTQSVG